MRKVRGLIDVQEVAPPGNRRGGTKDFHPSAAAGLRYERYFGKHLEALELPASHGPWLRFLDSKGAAYAQPDYVTKLEDRVIVWEAKLTQKAEGELKLDKLYVPLVKRLFGLPTFGVMVFKNILWQPTILADDVRTITGMSLKDRGQIIHLHWIGP